MVKNKVLVRLQNDREKYCNQCWTLHHGWRCDRIGRSVSSLAVQNVALLGLKIGSALRCTLPSEVQICPCQTVTFHRSQHIAEHCRGSRSDLCLDYSSFKVAPRLDGGRKIFHSCSVAINEATLYVLSTVMVCNYWNHLRVTNHFSLRVHDPSPSYFVRVHSRDTGSARNYGLRSLSAKRDWSSTALFGDLFGDLIHVHRLA